MPSEEVLNIQAKLAEPFPVEDLGFKPQSVKGNRALAVAFIDARDVAERLDKVLGADCWEDSYFIFEGGSVECKLRVKIGGEWVTKIDVGSPSDQPDGGDRLKAAYSDALKRVAVKLGVGRYIYKLPLVWCDYDPVKKEFVKLPQLPAWAMPGYKEPPKTPPVMWPSEKKPEPKPVEAEAVISEDDAKKVKGLLSAVGYTADDYRQMLADFGLSPDTKVSAIPQRLRPNVLKVLNDRLNEKAKQPTTGGAA